jgi:hypothetical protein
LHSSTSLNSEQSIKTYCTQWVKNSYQWLLLIKPNNLSVMANQSHKYSIWSLETDRRRQVDIYKKELGRREDRLFYEKCILQFPTYMQKMGFITHLHEWREIFLLHLFQDRTSKSV